MAGLRPWSKAPQYGAAFGGLLDQANEAEGPDTHERDAGKELIELGPELGVGAGGVAVHHLPPRR